MSKNTLRTLVVSLAMATGAAGVVQAAHAADTAATPPAVTAPAGKEARDGGRHDFHGRHHMHGKRMAHHASANPLAVLPRLESRLNLTESQQTLWRAAKSQGREAFKSMHEQRTQDRKALRDQLAAGPLDLRALSAKDEAARTAVAPKLKAARDAWLVAYDSLDAKQKQVVSDAVKRGIERGHRHGGPRDGGPRASRG